MGSKHFHTKDINLSYRNRGKLARIQIKQNPTIIIYKPVMNILLLVNIIEKISLINKIFKYSLIKTNVNPNDPYSVINPETNSEPPSEKS